MPNGDRRSARASYRDYRELSRLDNSASKSAARMLAREHTGSARLRLGLPLVCSPATHTLKRSRLARMLSRQHTGTSERGLLYIERERARLALGSYAERRSPRLSARKRSAPGLLSVLSSARLVLWYAYTEKRLYNSPANRHNLEPRGRAGKKKRGSKWYY